MKNIKSILVALAAFAVLLTPSCDTVNGTEGTEDNNVNFTFSVSPKEIVFESEGGVEIVEVTTTAESWEVVNAISWVEVECAEQGFYIYANENQNDSSRNGEIFVIASSGSISREITISVEQVANGGVTAGGDLTFECPVFESLVLSSYAPDCKIQYATCNLCVERLVHLLAVGFF